jgi:hypothetical protein
MAAAAYQSVNDFFDYGSMVQLPHPVDAVHVLSQTVPPSLS